MGDDDGGDAEIAHQNPQEIKQTGLNRHIEPTGRFVHENEARFGYEHAGYLQALLHAAGELPRSVVDPVG